MKTKTITLYNLDELSKEAQEKAHRYWIAGNEYDFLGEALEEVLIDKLEENKITTINSDTREVFYSLSNSQGDGVMFEGSFKWKKYTVRIKQDGRYYNSYSKTVEIFSQREEDLSLEDVTNDESEKVYGDFETIYQKICKDLEKYGYDWIEEEDSFERFKDDCEANEYTFLSDGTMEN